MSVQLNVIDTDIFNQNSKLITLCFSMEKISIKELIETRVMKEFNIEEEHKLKRADNSFIPTAKELKLNPAPSDPQQDVEIHKDKAITSFLKNEYFIFINDVQKTDIEERILLSPTTRVTFLKLTPLIGG
ncbi:hypothetical protein ACMXYN_00025 [Neptuniibacter sp. PT8_73]|uniref:hypothetical protein n=1 Tax=Neptuniibacter sp. PT8_73 TaxID=3398206 RepID=UPI0039F4DB4F